jgi:hypothetical protein
MATPPRSSSLAVPPRVQGGQQPSQIPADLDKLDPSKGNWNIYYLTFEGKRFIVPYKVSGRFKIHSMSIDLHSSVTISISDTAEDRKRGTENIRGILSLPKFLLDSIAELDTQDLHFIYERELGNKYENISSRSDRPYIISDKQVECYRLITDEIRALRMIQIEFSADSKENITTILIINVVSETDSGGQLSESSGHAREYWEKMDSLFYSTMKTAEQSYETNRIINIIVVAIGIVLIANAIILGWVRPSSDAWSIVSGGIGIVAFLAHFFVQPQSRITRSLGNLAQIQMIHKAHSRLFESISDYDWLKFRKGDREIEEVKKMDEELERGTKEYVKLVEEYIIDSEKPDSGGS